MQNDQATGATRCGTCGATDGFTKRPEGPEHWPDRYGNTAASAAGAPPVEKLTTWRCGRCGQDFETAVYVPDPAPAV